MIRPKKCLRVCFDKNVIKKELEFMSDMICNIMKTTSKSADQESVKKKIISEIIPVVTENVYKALQLDELLKPHKIVPLVPRDVMLDMITPGTEMFKIANRDDGTDMNIDGTRKNIVIPSVLQEDHSEPYVPEKNAIIEPRGTRVEPIKWDHDSGKYIGGSTKWVVVGGDLAEKVEQIKKKKEALDQIAKETITVKKSDRKKTSNRRKNSGK